MGPAKGDRRLSLWQKREIQNDGLDVLKLHEVMRGMLDLLNPEGCEDQSRICIRLQKGDVLNSTPSIGYGHWIGLGREGCRRRNLEHDHFLNELALKGLLQQAGWVIYHGLHE